MGQMKKAKQPSSAHAKSMRRKSRRRTSGGRKKSGKPLSREQYNSIFRQYQKGDSASAIAKELGICHPTVTKYINQGDPTRGWEPLKDRLARLRAKAYENADEDAVKSRSRIYAQAQNIMVSVVETADVFSQRIIAYRNAHTSIESDGTISFSEARGRGRTRKQGWDDKSAGAMVMNLERACRNAQNWLAVLNGMVGWGEDNSWERQFDGWSVEELEDYARDGVLPERLLGESGVDLPQ